MQLDKMEGYIERNSKKALEAKDAEIQHLKTALEVSETENEKLKWELANVTKELAKVERELFCNS